MNIASTPIKLLPESDSERMARLREEADAENDRICEDLISGRHDEQRLRRSRQAMQFVNSLPPVALPDPVEARRKADESMAGLVRDYLGKIGGRL